MSEAIVSYGMVGGGPGSFIGDVHRKAAEFDRKAELKAGCFSRDYEKTLQTGSELALSGERLYRDYQQMAREEALREDGIDFVSIVTPNYLHYEIARTFLEQGIHVVCDKPLTISVEQAEDLTTMVREQDLLFCVTYTYSGYPMVKQARAMVENGDIGDIRMVVAEYPQEWLATPAENEGNKQAAWRTDPCQSGRSNCVGDIGSHVENTVSYISGLEIETLAANLDAFNPGRELDDNAAILVKYKGGATGVYWCSQVAIGHDNDLRIRIFGSRGSLEWSQENPNYLKVSYLDKPTQTLSRGRDQLYPAAADLPRIPAGHPEGYYEAFANIYAGFTQALLTRKAGKPLTGVKPDFPGIEAGLQGVKFINRAVDSAQNGATWVEL